MMESTSFWDTLRQSFSNFFGSEGFKAVAGEVVPALAGGAVSALSTTMFPGTPERQIGMDTRTGTGQGAEGIRYGAAKGAGRQYQAALRGELDPREEQLLRQRERSASAASGSLETGGHVVRERNAIADQVGRNRRDLAGQVGTLTSGYSNLTPYRVGAQASPWAKLLSGAVAPALTKGVSEGWKRWSAIDEPEQLSGPRY
jgi:hypothetical protein